MIAFTAKRDRYPGIKAFEKSQEALFKGRDKEIFELFNLILGENCVVLFAKSGLGKSSLLNAGISPLLERKGFIPVNIRLQLTGDFKTPLSILQANLNPFAGKIKIESYNNDPEKLYLWEFIKSCDFPLGFTPVLILDQFEEFFSNRADHQNQFLLQLGEILHSEPPVRILEWYNKIPVEERTIEQVNWCSQPRIKLVIGVREDRFGELNTICKIIPGIMRNTFKLNPLSVDNAREAIEKPAAMKESIFDTLPFRYHKEALETIINKLSGGKRYVETTQLQIVCHQIEKTVKEKQLLQPDLTEIEVTESFFGGKAGIDDMIRNFYNRQIDHLSTDFDQQKKVRDLIETVMVQNGKRVLLYEDQVIDFLMTNNEKVRSDISKPTSFDIENIQRSMALKLIDDILELRLIRGDFREDQKLYEISHDTLLGPISTAISERKIKADKDKLELERIRIEKERNDQKEWLLAEKKKVEKERKLKEKAEVSKAEAERALIIAKNATEKAQMSKKEADRVRKTARTLSITIFILGLAALIAGVLFFREVKKERKKNAEYLSNIFVGKANDEIDNLRNYSAFSYAYLADSLNPSALTASIYSSLKDGIFTGKFIKVYNKGKVLAIETKDSVLYIWNIGQLPFRLIKEFRGHRSYKMSENGNKILLEYNKGLLELWDLDKDRKIENLPNLDSAGVNYLNLISRSFFSDNGALLAIYDISQNLRIYKVEANSVSLYQNKQLYDLDQMEKNREPKNLLPKSDLAAYRIKPRSTYITSIINFSSDGSTILFFSSPNKNKYAYDIHCFSIVEESKPIRVVKNVSPVFLWAFKIFPGDSLLYRTEDNSCYVLEVKSNNVMKSDPITNIFKKYYKNSDFSTPYNSLNYILVDPKPTDRSGFRIINYRNSKSILINIKNGEAIMSFQRKYIGYGTDQTFYTNTFVYLDTNSRFAFNKYYDSFPYFKTDFQDMLRSSSYGRGRYCLSQDEKIIAYKQNDSIFIWDVPGKSIIRKIHSPSQGATMECVNNSFFIVGSTKNLWEGENDYYLIPYDSLNKDQLRQIYPDLTWKIRVEYKLKK